MRPLFTTPTDLRRGSSSRTMIQDVAEVICCLDRDGQIMAINRACTQDWGYSPEELQYRNILDLVHPSQRQSTARRFAERLGESGRSYIECDVLRRDGSLVSLRWSIIWSSAEVRFICVAHDITQQKQMEKLKAEFLSMISHDLRTPLASISSFLELIITGGYGELPTPLALAAVLGRRSMKRLIKLTDDLLDLERLESGAFTLQLGNPDIKDVVEDAFASLKQFADDAGVSIDINRVRRCRLKVEGDQARLTQVVVNLLSNAIKFSKSGATVTVVAARKGDWVELSVIDTGRGIPAHLQDFVFDRFRQLETHDINRGSGLGLAISKTIIDQHGGKIGVDSQVGCGSRFWFRVRLAGTINSSQKAVESTMFGTAAGRSPAGKETVPADQGGLYGTL